MSEKRAADRVSIANQKSFIVLVAVMAVMLLLFGCKRPGQEASKKKSTKTVAAKKSSSMLSRDQREIVDTFGHPSFFSLYYMPMTDRRLIRVEAWYYAELKKKITFVAGQVQKLNDFNVSEDNQYSDIRISDFDYSMNYKEVVEKIEADPVVPADFVNDMFEEEDARTYVGDKVIFTIEQGHLVYMQTMGVKY